MMSEEPKRMTDEHLNLMLTKLQSNPPQNRNEEAVATLMREFVTALKTDRARIAELEEENKRLRDALTRVDSFLRAVVPEEPRPLRRQMAKEMQRISAVLYPKTALNSEKEGEDHE